MLIFHLANCNTFPEDHFSFRACPRGSDACSEPKRLMQSSPHKDDDHPRKTHGKHLGELLERRGLELPNSLRMVHEVSGRDPILFRGHVMWNKWQGRILCVSIIPILSGFLAPDCTTLLWWLNHGSAFFVSIYGSSRSKGRSSMFLAEVVSSFKKLHTAAGWHPPVVGLSPPESSEKSMPCLGLKTECPKG